MGAGHREPLAPRRSSSYTDSGRVWGSHEQTGIRRRRDSCRKMRRPGSAAVDRRVSGPKPLPWNDGTCGTPVCGRCRTERADSHLTHTGGRIAMHDVATALNAVRARIAELERRYRREPGSVRLLAVSKTKPPETVRAAIEAGQPGLRRKSPPGRDDQDRRTGRAGRLMALHRRPSVEQDPPDRRAFRLGPQHPARKDRDPPLRTTPPAAAGRSTCASKSM